MSKSLDELAREAERKEYEARCGEVATLKARVDRMQDSLGFERERVAELVRERDRARELQAQAEARFNEVLAQREDLRSVVAATRALADKAMADLGSHLARCNKHAENFHRSRAYRQEHIASVACAWAFTVGQVLTPHQDCQCEPWPEQRECDRCVGERFMEKILENT